jgi:hypothetical protein
MHWINYLPPVFWLFVWILCAAAYTSLFKPCLIHQVQISASIIICCPFIKFSIICLWSYFKLSWGDPGSSELFLKIYNLTCNKLIQALPKCPQCGNPKPARTQHCSDCEECYFRLDHHCPVWGNCIVLFLKVKSFYSKDKPKTKG